MIAGARRVVILGDSGKIGHVAGAQVLVFAPPSLLILPPSPRHKPPPTRRPVCTAKSSSTTVARPSVGSLESSARVVRSTRGRESSTMAASLQELTDRRNDPTLNPDLHDIGAWYGPLGGHTIVAEIDGGIVSVGTRVGGVDRSIRTGARTKSDRGYQTHYPGAHEFPLTCGQ